MTLDQARANIGAGVVYTPAHGGREQGRITSVNDSYIFVDYDNAGYGKATLPEDLELLR